MGGSMYTVILRANENVPLVWNFISTHFLKVSDYILKVGWITTSDTVETTYLLHYDVILQIKRGGLHVTPGRKDEQSAFRSEIGGYI
jgi:hypothetical protein